MSFIRIFSGAFWRGPIVLFLILTVRTSAYTPPRVDSLVASNEAVLNDALRAVADALDASGETEILQNSGDATDHHGRDLLLIHEGWDNTYINGEEWVDNVFVLQDSTLNPQARFWSVSPETLREAEPTTLIEAMGLIPVRTAEALHLIDPLLVGNQKWPLNWELGAAAQRQLTLREASDLLIDEFDFDPFNPELPWGTIYDYSAVVWEPRFSATCRDLVASILHFLISQRPEDTSYYRLTGPHVDPIDPAESFAEMYVIRWTYNLVP